MDGSYNSLEHLNRALATSAPVGSFVPDLHISDETLRLTQQCRLCCHWSLPLNAPYLGRQTPNGAALTFNEWIGWHIHVIQHQHLDRPDALRVLVS